jgi:hypothetical protein
VLLDRGRKRTLLVVGIDEAHERRRRPRQAGASVSDPLHRDVTETGEAQGMGAGRRQVDDPAADEGTTVGNGDDDRAVVLEIGYPSTATERQCPGRGGEVPIPERNTGCGAAGTLLLSRG